MVLKVTRPFASRREVGIPDGFYEGDRLRELLGGQNHAIDEVETRGSVSRIVVVRPIFDVTIDPSGNHSDDVMVNAEKRGDRLRVRVGQRRKYNGIYTEVEMGSGSKVEIDGFTFRQPRPKRQKT